VCRHGVAGAPTPAVRRSQAAHDDDAPVLLALGRCVGVRPFARQLGHGRRGILEGEERGQRVLLEASLQVARRRIRDGGRAQQPGRADPDIKPPECIEHLVDENKRLLFLRDVEWVGDDLRIRVLLCDSINEVLVRVRARRLIARCSGSVSAEVARRPNADLPYMEAAPCAGSDVSLVCFGAARGAMDGRG